MSDLGDDEGTEQQQIEDDSNEQQPAEEDGNEQRPTVELFVKVWYSGETNIQPVGGGMVRPAAW